MSSLDESFLVGLIGDGITASLSPPLHEREAGRHGLSYIYRTVDVLSLATVPATGRAGYADEAVRLLDYGRKLGFNAFNITHPYKQSILPALDCVDNDAARIGAVNTVVFDGDRAIGHNTDFSGYLAGLRAVHPDADLSRVVQLGAGGAGSAVAFGLLREGARRLELIDLDEERARARAAELQRQFPDQEVVPRPHDELRAAVDKASGFAQCTPVGMHLAPGMPLDPDWLRPGLWVSDVVYLPLETELVREARARGLVVVDGGRMLVGQAAAAFRLITGESADADAMRRDFVEVIASR